MSIGDSPSDLASRLDRIIAILQLAHRHQITEAQAEIRADDINRAILEATADEWIKSGDLQRAVSSAKNTSTRTVRDRLKTLLGVQALEHRGGGATIEYRATGLL